jgi:uncharacterized protein YndB with AHSA1/START domain
MQPFSCFTVSFNFESLESSEETTVKEVLTAICTPDLSARPFRLRVERDFPLPPSVLFQAWTEKVDSWFASPGMILMNPEVDAPFFFQTDHEGMLHPHYGRFLKLELDRLVEMTWVTGTPGTKGAETVITVELTPLGTSTKLWLTHAGFVDEESRRAHAEAWPRLLPRIEERFAVHND